MAKTNDQEVEVKIFNIDVAAVRHALLSAGAEKIFEGQVSNTHFDFPDYRLQKQGAYLRVRTMNGELYLALKSASTSATVSDRDEQELRIGSAAEQSTLEKILAGLGLRTMFSYTKHRESYQLGDTRFDIDSLKNLAPYVEVEASNERSVARGVALLGYSMQQTFARSVLAYAEQNDINPRTIGFTLASDYNQWRAALPHAHQR